MNTKTVSRGVQSKQEVFKKSSFSDDYGKHCVGVCINESGVYVVNTNESDGPILTFTYDEWHAFVRGVKNNEFDIHIDR